MPERRGRKKGVRSDGDLVIGGTITAGRRIVGGDQINRGEESVVVTAGETLFDGRPLPEGAIVSKSFALGGIESPDGKYKLLYEDGSPVITKSGKFVYVRD